MAETLMTEDKPIIDTPTVPPTTPPVTPPDWFKDLPAEMQSEKMFAPFKGKPLSELAKSYVEKEKLIGSSIRLPGDKDKPEEKAAKISDIYNKLGRPDKPEGYTIEAMPELPEGMQWDEAQVVGLRQLAHKHGLSNAGFGELLQYYAQNVHTLSPNVETISQQTREKLVEEVGEQTYKRMIGFAYKAALHYGGEEYVKHLDTTGLGSDEWTIRVLSKAGRDLAEHGVVEPDAMVGGAPATSETAKAKIAEIMNDKDHPYFDRKKAGHEEAVEEMVRLHKIAYEGQ